MTNSFSPASRVLIVTAALVIVIAGMKQALRVRQASTHGAAPKPA